MEHGADDAGKSLLAFLHEHYTEEHAANAAGHHGQDHQNLPFKSHHSDISQAPVFCVNVTAFNCVVDGILPATEMTIYTESFHHSSALSKIWQPPRFC